MPDIHARHLLTPEGWQQDKVLHTDPAGRIAGITSAGDASFPRVDLLLPAPTNLHSHTFQRALAGLTEARGPDASDSFWTWRDLMYRFLHHLNPDQVEAIAAQAFVEMLESGFGAVAEFHYLHHAPGGQSYGNPAEMALRITSAAARAGIGLTLLPVLYMQGGCDGRALSGGQLRFGCDLDRYARLLERTEEAQIDLAQNDTHLGVAPHSLRAVPPDALRHVATMRPDAPVHLHLAEQRAEVSETEAHLGARPVTWLLDNQAPDTRWCLIHCTQMSETETRRLAAQGAVAGLCPLTEANLGDGIFNGVRFRDAGGRFGVGSDSNVHISLWAELAALDYSQRLRDGTRAALATPEASTGRVLFDAACQGGGQAAGRASGRIATGCWADLIGLRADTPELCGREGDAWLDSLIFCGRGDRHITDVWSAGRHVVQDSRHIARERIAKDYMAVLRDLSAAL